MSFPRALVVFCTLYMGFTPLAPAQGVLEGLYDPPRGTARGVSSSTQALELNADSLTMEPGETLTLADLEGRGVITRFAAAVHSEEPQHRRLLMLRMYWDGEEHPSVESPLGDFFAVGYGLHEDVESYVVQTATGGRMGTSLWPMPFRKAARITLTNEGELPVDALIYAIDWTEDADVPRGTPYFHAEYRQSYPAKLGKNYVVADIDGSGRYVGTVLSVRKRERGWWGEGDPFIYIDGERSPSIRGTATDDYFGQTAGLAERTGLFTGTPHAGGSGAGTMYTMYRWHIHDAMNFSESFRFEFEHKGFSRSLEYLEREDDFSSVAFWYQKEPHKKFAGVPEGYGRLHVGSLIEGAMASDLPREEKADKLREYLRAAAVTSEVVRVDSPETGAVDFEVLLTNATSVPLTVEGTITEIPGAKIATTPLAIQLAPQSEQRIAIEVAPESGALDWRAINAVQTNWKFSYPPPFNEVVETNVRHFLRIDHPHTVTRRTDSVTIDGKLNDWPSLPYVCETPQQVRVQYTDWIGPEDSSFKFATAYDDQYLYIAVETIDDRFRLSPMEDPWWQDLIEVRIDARPEDDRATWNASAGELDQFLFFALTPTEAGDAPIAVAAESLPAGSQYVCVRTKQGHNTEIAIPHAALDAAQGNEWTAFRLNIAIDDLDADFSEFNQVWWRPDWRYGLSYDHSGTFTRE